MKSKAKRFGKRLGAAVGLLAALVTGCATNMGTGTRVVEDLASDHPITMGKLVRAHVEPSRRLRVYLQLCQNIDGVWTCDEHDPRILAVIESGEKQLLKRLAQQYLVEGSEMPVYVYGPRCDGLEEMILIPRCQTALALGVWDPNLRDYIVYSTKHGDTVIKSDGFENFIDVTARATSLARNAAKIIP